MRALSKICGLRRQSDIRAAYQAGARYAGFVFFEKSPRHLGLEAAKTLGAAVPRELEKVALVVEPDDALLNAVMECLSPQWVQLHGYETPKRVGEIKARFGVSVIKAIGISERQDLGKIDDYKGVADKILLDTKPPPEAALPGGNGARFDWTLLEAFNPDFPWMLAGGLTPDNVGEAIARTNAPEVDVSSGVEDNRGEKNPDKIARFVANAFEAPNGKKSD